tara:strand:- start:26 stop:352 length:327 start_codon:yes stop_codon:yes gene_type:complete
VIRFREEQMKTNKNKITFLDDYDFLKILFKPKKKSLSDYEKKNKKYYSRLRRLMKKHDITLDKDLSYWDFFTKGTYRTIGLNENVDDYITAYNFVKDEIENGTFFTNY